MGGALGASIYWGYHEQKRLLQAQVIAYFCFWSTAWFQKTAHSAKSILSPIPLMQTQMWEPENFKGLTILGQPVLLSVVPLVRPFLFIGKFFRQYLSLLLTQTTLTICCGYSWPAKSLVQNVTAHAPICAISAVTCSYLNYAVTGFLTIAESGFQLPLT